MVNVICGFVGGVVQSLLSGITGIISTLKDAFKAVLSLGGHFGDFLAAALGYVPREIIDLLIAGIAVSIALAIIKFIRGGWHGRFYSFLWRSLGLFQDAYDRLRLHILLLGYRPLGLCCLYCYSNYKGAFRWITN